MSEQTLYEIADDYTGLMQLMDDITNPAPPCRECNPERQDELTYALYRSTTDEFDCKTCNNTGFEEPWDDDGAMAAIADALEQIEDSMQGKTENIIRLCQSWTVLAEAIKIEEKRLAFKRKSLENRHAKLKRYLAHEMGRMDLKKIETPVKNASLTTGRKVVIIDDEMALPQGTYDTQMIIKPDKKAIKAALDADAEVPGAHLHKNDDYVTFR